MKKITTFYLTVPSLAAGLLWSCVTSSMGLPLKAEAAPNDATVEIVPEVISATGTVFSVEPEVLSVVMKDNPTPVRFYHNISTPVVDEKGVIIPLELIRPELPLTVDYVMDGEKMIAKKVVITRSMVAGDSNVKPGAKRVELAEAKLKEAAREADSTQAVAQTLIGTLSTVEQTITIVPRGETESVTCIINNSTRYVNIAGEPVSSALMMSGMPITVKTVRDGKRVLAQQITVRGNPATLSTGGAMAGSNKPDRQSPKQPEPGAGGDAGGSEGRPGAGATAPNPVNPRTGKIQATPGSTPPTPAPR